MCTVILFVFLFLVSENYRLFQTEFCKHLFIWNLIYIDAIPKITGLFRGPISSQYAWYNEFILCIRVSYRNIQAIVWNQKIKDCVIEISTEFLTVSFLYKFRKR